MENILLAIVLKNTAKNKTSKIIEFIKQKSINITELQYKELAEIINSYLRSKEITAEELKKEYEKAIQFLNMCQKLDINVISKLNSEYPKKLLTMKDSPDLLYYKGDISLADKRPFVAVVGSRKINQKEAKLARTVSKVAAENGFGVVSGLAIGCDTEAHKGCLEINGKTVAVLPSNPIEIYPKQNKKLAEKILESGGLLISEYKPGTKIFKSNFILRNRLQSALSEAVIVIATSTKGGTMHTVNFAEKQNKIICSILYPDNHKTEETSGNKQLIQEHRAIPIRSINDFINILDHIKNNQQDLKSKIGNEQQLNFKYNI